MKKFGSILLTFAVLFILCAGALPVYAATTITISANRTVLVVGQEASITVNFSTAEPLTYILTSSDESVVAINDDSPGMVYAVSKGTAVITAKAIDPDTHRAISASITIKVRIPTGLMNNVDYYIMNCGTEKLLSLASTTDADGVSLTRKVRSDAMISRWTLDIATDTEGNHTGVTQLISANSTANRRAYVSGTSLILNDVSSARTKFAVQRIESGTNQGKYIIRYGNQYVAMNSSGTVYITSSSSNNIYWCFMAVHIGYASMHAVDIIESSPLSIDTTEKTGNFYTVFRDLGYLTDIYINESAWYAYECITADDVCIIASHGNSGIIGCYTAAGEDNGSVSVDADWEYSYGLWNTYYHINDLEENEAATSRCVIYLGCNTANNFVYGSGDFQEIHNLLDATFAKGAHCVIGLTESVTYDDANIWIGHFINAIRDRKSINEAIEYADAVTPSITIWVNDTTTVEYS